LADDDARGFHAALSRPSGERNGLSIGSDDSLTADFEDTKSVARIR
jgi:hypothetical protein